MKITIIGQNVSITEAMGNYLNCKFNKITSRIDIVLPPTVILKREKKHHTLEVTFLFQKKEIFAKSTGNNFYKLVKSVASKLQTQTQKCNSKKSNYKGSVSLKYNVAG